MPPAAKNYQTANKDDYEMPLRAFEETKARGGNINFSLISPEKIKSNPSFSLDKISTRSVEIAKTGLLPIDKKKDSLKLPMIRTRPNPEEQVYESNEKMPK